MSQLTDLVQAKEEQLTHLRLDIEGQRKELEHVHEDKKTLMLDLERKNQLLLVQRSQLTTANQKLKVFERHAGDGVFSDDAATVAGVEKQLYLMNKKIGNMHKVTEREKLISRLQLLRRVEENSVLIAELNEMRRSVVDKDKVIVDLKLALHRLEVPAVAVKLPPPVVATVSGRPASPARDRRLLQETRLRLEAAYDHVAAQTMENAVLKDQVAKLLIHVNSKSLHFFVFKLCLY